MKAAIVADLHMRGKKLEDKKKAWERAVDEIIARKVDMVILAGDIFDTRNIGGREASTGTVYRAFMDQLQKLVDASIKVILLLGNHELATGDQLSALETLKGTGLAVIDTFDQFVVLEDLKVVFVPWVAPTEDRDKKLEAWFARIKKYWAKSKSYKLVVGHLTVKGALLPSGVSIQGSEFEVTQEQLEATGADLIVLGHIHKRQQIGKNIHYVGALTQDSFGDEGNPQGFMIIDTEKRTHEFVEIDAPEYHTLNGWEKFTKPLPKDGDYVKYRFKEKPENLEELLGGDRATVEIIPDREEVKREIEGVEAGRSDNELLDSYLTHRGWEKPARERMIKRAKELMEAII